MISFIDVAVIVLFTIQSFLLVISANEEFCSPSTFRGKSEEVESDDDNLLSFDKNCDDDGCDGQIGAEVAAVAAAAVAVEDDVFTVFDVDAPEDDAAEDIDKNEEVGCRGADDDDVDEDEDANNEEDDEMCNALSDNVDIVL